MKKIVLTVLLTALVISVCGCAVTVNPDDYAFRSGNVHASIIPDVYKIHRDEEIPKTIDKSMHFTVGTNDLGSAQFILSDDGADVRSIQTSVGDFASESGKTLPDGCVTVYNEYFHPITTMSPVKYYPDGLIPMEETAVEVSAEAGQNCALWFDAEVPLGTEPDIYKGSVTVTFDGGEFTVPVEIEVLDIEIPQALSLQSHAQIFTDVSNEYEGISTEERDRLTEQMRQLLLKNRLNPTSFMKDRFRFSTPQEYADYVADQFEADPRVTNHLLRFKSIDDLVQICDRLRERGVLDKCYIYPFDEPTQDQIENINTYLDNIKTLIPDLKQLICCNSWHPELLGHLNFWCGTDNIVANEDRTTAIRNTGSEVWRYGGESGQIAENSATHSLAYYAKIKELDLDGLLIWSIYHSGTFDSDNNVYLGWSRDMWNDVYCFLPREYWDPLGGGATFFYPGKEGDGIVGKNIICDSIRLRYLRQAEEFYELLTIRERQLTQAAEKLGILSDIRIKNLMSEYYSNAENALDAKIKELYSPILSANDDIIGTLYTDILTFDSDAPLIATVTPEDETLFAKREIYVYAAPGSEVLVNGKQAAETQLNEKVSCYSLVIDCPEAVQSFRVSVNGEIIERNIYAKSVDNTKYFSIFADGGISQEDYEAVLSKSPDTVTGFKDGTIELDLSDPAKKVQFNISSLGHIKTADLEGATHVAVTLTNRMPFFVMSLTLSVETKLKKIEIDFTPVLDPGITKTVYIPLDSFYASGQKITNLSRLTLRSPSDNTSDLRIAVSEIAFVSVE